MSHTTLGSIISPPISYGGLPRWCRRSVCQCRRCQRHRFNPWVGKIPWSRKRQPAPVFLLGTFHGQRSLVGYSPWGCRELDTPEHISYRKLPALPQPTPLLSLSPLVLYFQPHYSFTTQYFDVTLFHWQVLDSSIHHLLDILFRYIPNMFQSEIRMYGPSSSSRVRFFMILCSFCN